MTTPQHTDRTIANLEERVRRAEAEAERLYPVIAAARAWCAANEAYVTEPTNERLVALGAADTALCEAVRVMEAGDD